MRPKIETALNVEHYTVLLEKYSSDVERELEKLRLVNARVREELYKAVELAMYKTAYAPVPECGDFGSIAQSLDYCLSEISGNSGDLVSLRDQVGAKAIRTISERGLILFKSKGEDYDRGYRDCLADYERYLKHKALDMEKGRIEW